MGNETYNEQKATLIIALVKNAPTPDAAHKQVTEQLDDLVDRAIAGSKALATASDNAKVQKGIADGIEKDRAARAERAAALGDASSEGTAPDRQSSHDYKAGDRVTLPGGAVGVAAKDGKSADTVPASTLVDGTVTWNLV